MINEIEQLLLNCKVSLHITWNQHKAYYQSVEEYLKGNVEACQDYDDMIELDRICEVQVYPDNPRTFYICYAPTLQAALTEVLKEVEIGRKK